MRSAASETDTVAGHGDDLAALVSALNDQRMLEGIRQDTMDAMRRYFLLNCPAGRIDK